MTWNQNRAAEKKAFEEAEKKAKEEAAAAEWVDILLIRGVLIIVIEGGLTVHVFITYCLLKIRAKRLEEEAAEKKRQEERAAAEWVVFIAEMMYDAELLLRLCAKPIMDIK